MNLFKKSNNVTFVKIFQIKWWLFKKYLGTGKSFSEVLILESVNPQYDERLFIEFPEKYKFTICCVQILFWMSKQKKQFLYTTCCELVFFREFNEQSLVILRVNRCKNESFWKRFTCKMKVFYSDDLHFPVKSTLRLLVKSKKVWLYMNLFPYSILILPNVKSVLN